MHQAKYRNNMIRIKIKNGTNILLQGVKLCAILL